MYTNETEKRAEKQSYNVPSVNVCPDRHYINYGGSI